ncbi:MAG: UTP--glucose-1-phosphate uridylyltransferase GalU [Bacillota bacterium]|nr:UTP--glucose-1-phosphate uridylyltransferase GalU [Bacillota bacterium]
MVIRKAVIPAAGFGTRMLPATKAIPKELVTVVDKPAIQYVVEEAVEAGVTDICIITGRGKGSIEDHFDRAPELEGLLAAKKKDEARSAVVAAAHMARFSFVRQQQPLGLGHAVACARSFVGGESFFVLLPDDLIQASTPCVQQLIEAAAGPLDSVIAVQEVPWEDTNKYGVVSIDPETGLVSGIVEKPDPAEAPSNLAVVGRYLLRPEIFACLGEIVPGAGGELQLTDAIALLIKQGLPVRACKFTGNRYDTGSPLGFLEANVGYALARPEMATKVRAMLTKLLDR